MLYTKIYVDTDTDGREMLVFTALAVVGKDFLVSSADYTAISPQAKKALLERLNSPDRKLDHYLGDFQIYGDDDGDHGYFFFKEKEIQDGQRIRVLRAGDAFSVKLIRGCRRSVLEYMVPCDNEFLKTLNLKEEIDENVLWAQYFTAMRERGETPACDAESIKHTPYLFLTEEQKEVIRKDYLARCEDFGEYHLRVNREEVDERVVSDLRSVYAKGSSEIQKICGITT